MRTAFFATSLALLLGVACSSSDPEDGGGGGSSSGGSSGSSGGSSGTGGTFGGPIKDPATLSAQVVVEVRTAEERKPISRWLYGVNLASASADRPADLLAAVTFVRRGGDRANAYNWETNVSNGSHNNGFQNDYFLVEGLANKNEPAALDLDLIRKNRAAGRGTMVPFVMNDYVAGPTADYIPYAQAGWDRNQYFKRVRYVKQGPLGAPDPNDGDVYTDEHLEYLRTKLGEDIYKSADNRVMVGTDNEPDLFAYNFPMLQDGNGEPLYEGGNQVGKRVTGDDFTARFIQFATRVKQLEPDAMIIGPGHYAFDGWTTWHGSMNDRYSNLPDGRWYIDDFLAQVKRASDIAGTRLLDVWDMHWYPQRTWNVNGSEIFTHYLDESKAPLTDEQIDAVLQDPRGYWDPEYNDQSWIVRDHMKAPTNILNRLRARIDAAYPGTDLGVTEYFPGGMAHISSGMAVVDALGVFARMGVKVAALWPHEGRVEYAYGGIKLLRNAGGTGTRFADTVVKVVSPEKVESSVHAGADSNDMVTVTVINKTKSARQFGLRLWHPGTLTKVEAFVLDQAHPNATLAGTETLTQHNAYTYNAPPLTATMLVFKTR